MTTSVFDPRRYKEGQRHEWDGVAAAWVKWWRLFEEWGAPGNERLIEVAQIGPHHTVLDAATGIGEPALTISRRLSDAGRVVATDQSPGMLSIARKRAAEEGVSNVTFVEMDAEALDFPAGHFDSAVCRFGLMFLPDVAAALARIHHSLRPGSVFATAVWGTPDKVPYVAAAFAAARRVIDPPPPPPPPEVPNMFKLGAPGLLASLFESAGFTSVRTESLTVPIEFETPEEYVEFLRDIAPPVRAAVAEQPTEVQAAYWRALAEEAGQFAGSDGRVHMPSEALLVSGQRRA